MTTSRKIIMGSAGQGGGMEGYNLTSWGKNAYMSWGDGNTDRTLSRTYAAAPANADPGSIWSGAGTMGQNAGSAWIDVEGNIWTWGYAGPANGARMGRGDLGGNNMWPTPVKATDTGGFIDVVMHTGHSIARKDDGTLWACGENSSGECGMGHTSVVRYFTQVDSNTNWDVIHAGDNCAFASRTDGTLWSWGNEGGRGKLGLGYLGSYGNVTTPTQVASGMGINFYGCKFSGANYQTHVLIRSGTYALKIYVWGDDYYGALCKGTNQSHTGTPTQLSGDWLDVGSTGHYNCFAVALTGALFSGGSANWGYALGHGDTNNRSTLVQTPASGSWYHPNLGTQWTGASFTRGGLCNRSAGSGQMYYIRDDGTLWYTGSGSEWQGPSHSNGDFGTPTQIGSRTDWIAACGSEENSTGIWGTL